MMINKRLIINKIKDLKIVKELKVTDNEIERMFASFHAYINLNEECSYSNDEICNIHHYTYIRNPKTNHIIEVKCYCDKQKKLNKINNRVLYSTNRDEVIEVIKQPSINKNIKYQLTSSNINDSNHPSVYSKGLYMYGEPHIGKTEFLYILLKETFMKSSGTVSFVDAKDLFEMLQSRNENKHNIEQIIKADTLFIDNFGLEKWPRIYLFEEELNNFLQERLSAKKTNFISSAIPINELRTLYKSRKVHIYKINFLIETIKKLTNNVEIKIIQSNN